MKPTKSDRNRSVVLTPKERVHLRTFELARMAGRGETEIRQADYERAKRDITGEVDLRKQNRVLDPKSQRPYKNFGRAAQFFENI